MGWVERFFRPEQQIGSRGEQAAHLYLRRLGYTNGGADFGSARGRGERELIGWDQGRALFY